MVEGFRECNFGLWSIKLGWKITKIWRLLCEGLGIFEGFFLGCCRGWKKLILERFCDGILFRVGGLGFLAFFGGCCASCIVELWMRSWGCISGWKILRVKVRIFVIFPYEFAKYTCSGHAGPFNTNSLKRQPTPH